MQIIIPPASIVEQVAGKQKRVEDQSYRLMTYVMQCPVHDGVLLYHTLTCCLLLLTPEEAAHITELPELIERWFLVPLQHDDGKLCRQILQVAQLLRNPAKTITTYTILTTTGCNARCFYCYERGATPVDMTPETTDRVCRFILDHHGDEEVKFRWFGGEPLVNVPVIDRICSTLRKHGVPFHSQMVSNGYLFDAGMVRRAKDLWGLQEIQITLDGTERTYNRIKRYIHGDANAFERVLGNIGMLADAGIHVRVRLNVDKHNIEEMDELVSLLHRRFGANGFLTVYSHELFGERSAEDSAALYRQRMALEQHIADCGYQTRRKLLKKLKLNLCMADDDQSVTIDPTGQLGKCEHHFDRNFFGHIDSEERDGDVIRRFGERAADIEACATCPYYPQCIRLVMCEDGNTCTPEKQKENIYYTLNAMRDEYQNFINHQQHEA